MASMNMAMYLFLSDLDLHLFISGTGMSVILDIVDLLYLLWSNSSRILAIFLVEMLYEYTDITSPSIPKLR